jgi:hypothetical protein
MAYRCLTTIPLALLSVAAAPCWSITLGQVDTFQSLSVAGWTSGPANPVQPTVVSSGGPAGAGDAYLSILSNGGSGVGSRLVGINAAQWTGNYAAAGVTGISMHVANFGTTNLQLRLVFYDDDFVTSAVALPAGSGWTAVRFSFNPAAIRNFSDLRLFHGSANSASFPGPPVLAQLGVDNITAIPEPAAWATLGLGLVLLAARRLRSAAAAA